MSYKKRVRVTIVCVIMAFAVLGCVDVHEIQSSMLSEPQPTVVWFSDSNMNADVDEDYPDFDLEHLSITKQEENEDDSSRVESIREHSEDNGGCEGSESVVEGFNESGSGDEPVNDSDSGHPVEVEGSTDEADPLDGGRYEEDSMPELVESEACDEIGLSASLVEYGNTDNGDVAGYSEEYDDGGDSGFSENSWSEEERLTYLGDWTITAYCPCEICCGQYSSGYTASGTLATAGRTIACNSLPIGTQVMIDGNVYTVEDTGWSPYGENWIDIFFNSHDEALAYGMQTREVYLVG